MEIRPWSATRPGSLDLSRAPGFVLGPLRVDPSLRRISAGGGCETLEPRVMRVLVALAEASGAVLSRDALIAQCWDGLIVGDNAIDRVLSLLRRTFAELAGDAVRLETITKVGFRLVVSEEESSAPEPSGSTPQEEPGISEATPQARAFGRRGMIVGGAVLAMAAVGGGGFAALQRSPTAPDPRAIGLARKADLLMKSGLPGTTRQATSYLEQAVAIDPDYAEGWGMLAGMYRHSFQGFSAGERQSFPRMVGSAAQRALALDPDQPDAQLALAVMRPFLGRWVSVEDRLRDIQARFPGHWYANAQLGLMLMDVGRFEEAMPFRHKVIAIDGAIPVAWGFLALNQLLANRLHEADRTLDRAAAIWPSHGFLWFMRYRVLLETGRPASAAGFARDPRNLPDDFPPEIATEAAGIAEAIASSDAGARRRAADYIVTAMEAPESAADGAPALALLGESALALEACSAYFLGGKFAGREWTPPGEFDNRYTSLLFYPSLLALRDSPRYAAILRRTGLEEYWRRSGRQPDFRRG